VRDPWKSSFVGAAPSAAAARTIELTTTQATFNLLIFKNLS
jgi:hypothetical protein